MIPILPVSGVPDELIRVLNARLRELETAIPAPATDPAVAPAASSRYTRVTSRETGQTTVPDAVLGASNLTNADAIPKVSAAGTLAESALKSVGNVVSMTDTRPTFLYDQGATARGRVFQAVTGHRLDLGTNVYYDGAAWQRDDVTASSLLFGLNSPAASGGFLVRYAAAAAGAIAWTIVLNFDAVTGTMDIPGVYKVAGTQVVGARQADPGVVAAAPAVSTSLTAQTADATYSANEQQMLNELKTSLGNVNTSLTSLETQVNNLRTDRDRLRAVLQAHGLMA